MIVAAHLEQCSGRQLLAGFFNTAFAGKHLAGEYQSLRPGPALSQATLNQRLVGALFCDRHCDRSEAIQVREAELLRCARNDRLGLVRRQRRR